MDPFGRELGLVLRRLRQDRGMTLRELAQRSGGRFKATSVAGYERGERAISLERFCDLAGFYGVAPDQVLAQVLERLEERAPPSVTLDLERLTIVLGEAGEEGRRIAALVERVARARSETPGRLLRLRSADVRSLALATHRAPADLVETLRPAIEEPPPPTDPAERPSADPGPN